jgi:hypothetical protein
VITGIITMYVWLVGAQTHTHGKQSIGSWPELAWRTKYSKLVPIYDNTIGDQ